MSSNDARCKLLAQSLTSGTDHPRRSNFDHHNFSWRSLCM